jgi:hypothetical protein
MCSLIACSRLASMRRPLSVIVVITFRRSLESCARTEHRFPGQFRRGLRLKRDLAHREPAVSLVRPRREVQDKLSADQQIASIARLDLRLAQ